MGFRVINGVSYPVGNFPVNTNPGSSEKSRKIDDISNTAGRSFKDILNETTRKSDGFTISNHAAGRMEEMNLNNKDMDKINDAINKAQDKGARNCLIVYKEVAMVTSIENRTVITAVSGERAKDNVFTNIDSVVLI